MTAPQTVADVLDKAATRLEQPGAWTQDAYAKRSDGSTTTTTADDAVCWCAVGAIGSVAGGLGEPIAELAADFLCEAVGTSVVDFNDHPDRQQSEVVAALREAATSARQGETK